MKRSLSFVLALLLILSSAIALIACGGDDVTTTPQSTTTTTKKLIGIVLPKDFEGAGTEEDPYLIDNPDTFLRLVGKSISTDGHKDLFYKLTANIDLTGKNWTPLDEFNGTLDGNGFAVIGMKSTGTLVYYADKGTKFGGFCGILDGTVKNIAFLNMSLEGTYTASGEVHGGMLAGYLTSDAVVENVLIHGAATAVKGADLADGTACGARFGTVGGYANTAPTFKNVVTAVQITNMSTVYRLAGSNTTLNATDCYSIFLPGSITENGWTHPTTYLASDGETGVKNFYSTGVKGNESVYSGNPTYAELGQASFYAGLTAPVTVADMYGDKMGLDASQWNTYADSAPLQKVFASNSSADVIRSVLK